MILDNIAGQMGDEEFWSMKPVLLATDAAAVLARRLYKSRMAKEQEKALAPPTVP